MTADRLYFHVPFGVLECPGCREYIEIPHEAVLKNGQPPVRIKNDPLNFLLWRELMEADHAPCSAFNDVRMAKEAREYRRVQ